jgi:hypothetical protein
MLVTINPSASYDETAHLLRYASHASQVQREEITRNPDVTMSNTSSDLLREELEETKTELAAALEKCSVYEEELRIQSAEFEAKMEALEEMYSCRMKEEVS